MAKFKPLEKWADPERSRKCVRESQSAEESKIPDFITTPVSTKDTKISAHLQLTYVFRSNN